MPKSYGRTDNTYPNYRKALVLKTEIQLLSYIFKNLSGTFFHDITKSLQKLVIIQNLIVYNS